MKSFSHAFRGIWHAVKTERNMRIHLAALYYVAAAGLLFDLNGWDWALISLACGLVIGAELLNTALERLCDGLEPGHSPIIKKVKDLAAGAVLVCAIAAVGVMAAVLWESFYLQNYLFYEYLIEQPSFWAGAIAAPFWIWFIVWFGRRKKEP